MITILILPFSYKSYKNIDTWYCLWIDFYVIHPLHISIDIVINDGLILVSDWWEWFNQSWLGGIIEVFIYKAWKLNMHQIFLLNVFNLGYVFLVNIKTYFSQLFLQIHPSGPAQVNGALANLKSVEQIGAENWPKIMKIRAENCRNCANCNWKSQKIKLTSFNSAPILERGLIDSKKMKPTT